ncbi:MAG: FMN-binding protein [Flavobacteriaceae bacterium]
MNYKQVIGFCFVFSLLSFSLPKNIQKRVDKEVKSYFNIEDYKLIDVKIESAITKDLPSKFGENNLFKIQANNSLLGYAYIASAPSKTAEFDYLVLFDTDWIIAKSKVLIYREEYGGEIGSKRWLRQFDGKKPTDELAYGDNIMAISGATISVRSMTNAINDLLKSIKILQQNEKL